MVMRIDFRRGLVVVVLTLFPFSAWAQNWLLETNAVTVGYGHEKNKFDDVFDGSKLLLSGQYVFDKEIVETSENDDCCWRMANRERLKWIVDGMFRVGGDGNGLEYTKIGVTPWALTRDPNSGSGRKLTTTRDQFELGHLRYVVDDALDVKSLAELSIVRVGRLGEYKWSDDSPYTVTLGGAASLGWAWVETNDPLYSTVSNPFAGVFVMASIESERMGRFYIDNRTVNGFSISNPSRGHPTARESRVAGGYTRKFSRGCLGIDIYVEKRSFYFDEGGVGDLYNANGTVGVLLTCNGF